MKLTLTNQTPRKIDEAWLRRQLRALLRLKKIDRGDWSITIVGDAAMKTLHKRTMNDPTTTDVLTFDLSDLPAATIKHQKPKIKNAIDLDTVICRDVAARSAKDLGHSVEHELLLYALHSLLHVQGYDDLTPADAARMHRREDALLVALGIGPLYNRTRSVSKGQINRPPASQRIKKKPKSKIKNQKLKNSKMKNRT